MNGATPQLVTYDELGGRGGVQVRVGGAFTRTFPGPYEATAWALKVEHVLGCDADDIEIDDHRPVYTVEDCRPLYTVEDCRPMFERMAEVLDKHYTAHLQQAIFAPAPIVMQARILSYGNLTFQPSGGPPSIDTWLEACPDLTRTEQAWRELRRLQRKVAEPLREARHRARVAWRIIHEGDDWRYFE